MNFCSIVSSLARKCLYLDFLLCLLTNMYHFLICLVLFQNGFYISDILMKFSMLNRKQVGEACVTKVERQSLKQLGMKSLRECSVISITF